jgi:hypothetical protein
MALRVVRSFGMTATRATFPGSFAGGEALVEGSER